MTDTHGHPDTGQPASRRSMSGAVAARWTDIAQRTGDSRLASVSLWAVLVSGFGLSASTWIALALLAGFDGQVTVPTMSGWTVTLRLAWLMPVAIDGYVVTALVLWMAPVPARVAAFAKKNTYGAAGGGVIAQAAYHCLTTWSTTGAVWRATLAMLVGAAPPLVSALAVHMRALIRRESGRMDVPVTDTPASGSSNTSADTAVHAAADAVRAVRVDTVPTIVADTVQALSSRPADTPPIETADTAASAPDRGADREADRPADTGNVTPIASRTRRAGQAADTSIERLADTLTKRFGPEYVGTPKALEELRRVYGSCSKDRAIAAKDIHNARREQADTPASDDEPTDRAAAAAAN